LWRPSTTARTCACSSTSCTRSSRLSENSFKKPGTPLRPRQTSGAIEWLLLAQSSLPNVGCVPGVLRDRNDLELLTGCTCYIPNSFAHQKPCHWGCEGKRTGLGVCFVLPHDTIFLYAPIVALEGRCAAKGNRVSWRGIGDDLSRPNPRRQVARPRIRSCNPSSWPLPPRNMCCPSPGGEGVQIILR